MSKIIWFDQKFKLHAGKYIFQCLLATFTILLSLIFLDVLSETAIITAIGASTFIVFTMPNHYSSDPRRLIGGYGVGLLIGFMLHVIARLDRIIVISLSENMALIIFGAFAVGFAIFVMAFTNTEHAPAAGIALGLVLNRWDYLTILFIVGTIIWLSCVRFLLRDYLMDLSSPNLKN